MVFDKHINFSYANFNDVSFLGSEFQNGEVIFSNAKFNGNACFSRTRLNNSTLNFSDVEFNDSRLIFNSSNSTQEKGNIRLTNIKIEGECEFYFSNMNFSNGDLILSGVSNGETIIRSQNSLFNSIMISDLINKSKIKCSFVNVNVTRLAQFHFDLKCKVNDMSLNNSSFEEVLSIAGDFDCVPNLLNTKTTNHVTLHKLKYNLNREWTKCKKKAVDVEDISKLRRLKEISETNKDHQASLRFNADEMRSKRWHELTAAASILDILFSILSNYGQSIIRPFIALSTLILTMTLYIYTSIAISCNNCVECCESIFNVKANTLLHGLEIAISHAFPFVINSRSVNNKAVAALALPEYFGIISVIYGIFCFTFIFLIGLGVRNRFRI